MKKNLKLKTLLIVGVVLLFLAVIVGKPKDWSWSGVKASAREQIKLGLDLRGGTHFILQVMVDEAVGSDTDRAIDRLRDDLRNANISYAEIIKPDPRTQPDTIAVRGIPSEQGAEFRELALDRFPDYEPASGVENAWTLKLKPAVVAQIRDRAVEQAIETIRGRVDALGVSEPVIQEHGLGNYQILIQLPGVDDPARVKTIMQSTARLEIRLVEGGPYGSEQAALSAQPSGLLPPDTVLLRERPIGGRTGEAPQEQWYLVTRRPAVAGRDLRDARMTRDEFGRPAVGFDLTADGGRRFGEFTSANVGRLLAVVLDNRIMSVATIQEQIRDQGRITGQFSEQYATDLAMILRSGALPASIRYLEERTVGPSLGVDSIRQGVLAAVVGLVAVMGFMLVYYRGAGVNANIALILNLVLLLGFLALSGAALTLPGIAGIILTIGMGVDSNVLIFERIREELRAGKTPASSVEQGFSRAWLTIVDTHVTTIVSAFILFIFGTGPVRGFAVTLIFGLLANLFTAVFVSRVIFDYILTQKQRGEALSI
jgi:preprotein translocase subunit SecD